MFWVEWLIGIMGLGIDLSDTYLYIVDIRFKQKDFNLKEYLTEKNLEVLSLTPYSSFLLDDINQTYTTFHNILSEEQFVNEVLKKYADIETIFLQNKEYSFLFMDVAFMITYEKYLARLFYFLNNKTNKNYKIIYISDSKKNINKISIGVKKSFLYSYKKFYKIINIGSVDKIFYKKQKIISYFKRILYTKNIFFKVFFKLVRQKSIEASYDNKYYIKYFINSDFKVINNINPSSIEKISKLVLESIIEKKTMSLVSNYYKNIFLKLEDRVKKVSSHIKYHPFTFLSKIENYYEILLYQQNNIPKIFMQHGSYFHENIFLKHNEIYPADISFVFNDYTKKLFEKRGARKVYSVGSVDFNYPIQNAKKFKYDYVYITYCTSYSYAGLMIMNENHEESIDSNKIFNHHKSIIKLFGTKLKDKKICIKIQPGIFLGTMLYIPLLELSKPYKNITIEFVVPLKELFQSSKYIISDYFSSEFINRELHHKKDIIMFKEFPIKVTEETLEDMKKMFILVDTMDDLKEKIENIEKITQNRKRYDDIIEYYSSKKCDTKNMINDILVKELNTGK